MDLAALPELARIDDPLERAQALTRFLAAQQELIGEASQLRRAAIAQARSTGMTQDEIARALGVTPGRVSQMQKGMGPVVTGWFLPSTSDPVRVHRIAICGSRAPGTDGQRIDDAVRALAGLLMRCRCRVSHGPVGVGHEVITYIGDHYRPPGLSAVTGIFGRPEVVRGADYVLVVGGGHGTQVEVDLAVAMGKRVVPMPTSGGTAARAYALLQRTPRLPTWLSEDDFAALAGAGADDYVRIVEQALSSGQSDQGVSHA